MSQKNITPYKDFPNIDSCSIQDRVMYFHQTVMEILESQLMSIKEIQNESDKALENEQYELSEAIKIGIVKFTKTRQLGLFNPQELNK